MMQILATIIYFVVFIQLFIALSLYIAKIIRDFYQESKKAKAKEE